MRMMQDAPKIDPAVQARLNFDVLCRYRVLDAFGLRANWTESDRVWSLVHPDVETAVRARFEQMRQAQEMQMGGAGLHAVPAFFIADCGATHSKVIASYRGRFPNSLAGDQWVLHRLFCEKVPKELVLEQDVDPHSPVDVAGFFPHLITVIRNKRQKLKTDPFVVARILDEAGFS